MDAAIATWYFTAVTTEQRMNTLKAVTRLLGLGEGGRGTAKQPMAAKLLRPGAADGHRVLHGRARFGLLWSCLGPSGPIFLVS